jgi:hypothetical protein
MKISAVLVTRGDVDLTPILNSLPVDDVVIWDNSKRQDFKVLGRYVAAYEARHSVIYTQDDDCVVDSTQVIAAYEPGRVVSNMPAAKRSEYAGIAPGVALVGWGACFDADLTRVFERYIARYGRDELLLRECDRVFTALNSTKLIDVPITHLPHAFAGRMGNETRHLSDLAEIQRRIASL